MHPFALFIARQGGMLDPAALRAIVVLSQQLSKIRLQPAAKVPARLQNLLRVRWVAVAAPLDVRCSTSSHTDSFRNKSTS